MKEQIIDSNFLDQIELLKLACKDVIAGRFGGNHKTKAYGLSSEFADFKEYMQGDDITKIDWPSFARTDKLFLKLFFDERQTHTKIFIDGSKSMDYENKGVKALQIAASIAYLSINYMDKVSIYLVKDDIIYDLMENIVGKDSYLNYINKLNNVSFDSKSHFVNTLIASSTSYGDGNTILISDFLSDDNYENLIDHLKSKRRDVICLQVLSETELNPFQRGKMILLDSENEKRIYKKNIGKEVLNAYKEALDFIVSRIKNYCLNHDASYLLCNANDSLQNIFFNNLTLMEVVK